MSKRLSLTLLFVCTLCGCVFHGQLYPVQGSLAAQTPIPVESVKMSGALNSGNVSVVLNAGEVCKGQWSVVPRGSGAGATATTSMSEAWDAVYGHGFYTSHVLGARLYARSTLTCNQGTKLNLEMYRPDTAQVVVGEIRGVAEDDKGNVYKLTF
jgi:hypothetical protein